MRDLIAKPGERVMDAQTGAVICRVKNPIRFHERVSVSDFHEFEPGDHPWQIYERVDPRCTRQGTFPWGDGLQMFIEGEWRPRS